MNPRRWLECPEDEKDPVLRELRQSLDEAARRTGDEVTRRRVWAQVAQPAVLPPRSRWPLVAAATLAGCTAAAIVLVRVVSSDPMPVAPSQSMAVRQAPVDPAVPAVVSPLPSPIRPSLVAPAVVRTADDEHLRLELGHGVQAEVGAASVLALDARGQVSVRTGEVQFKVAPREPGDAFSVVAGDYEVVVVGTRFRVTVRGDKVSVAVDEGVVEVWGLGTRPAGAALARLERGDSWSSGSRPASSSRASRPTVRPAEAPSAAETQAKARAALTAGDSRGALALYEALAGTDGPAAENAQYEIGRILRENLGQQRPALAAWERYRAKYPDGLLRAEADLSMIETLVALGETQRASSEVTGFLRRHPDSERRGEVARVAGDLARARGDCRTAVLSYKTALASPGARKVADHAAFHRAACLATLGEPSAAAELRSYERNFPSGRFRADAARMLRGLGEARTAAP